MSTLIMIIITITIITYHNSYWSPILSDPAYVPPPLGSFPQLPLRCFFFSWKVLSKWKQSFQFYATPVPCASLCHCVHTPMWFPFSIPPFPDTVWLSCRPGFQWYHTLSPGQGQHLAQHRFWEPYGMASLESQELGPWMFCHSCVLFSREAGGTMK